MSRRRITLLAAITGIAALALLLRLPVVPVPYGDGWPALWIVAVIGGVLAAYILSALWAVNRSEWVALLVAAVGMAVLPVAITMARANTPPGFALFSTAFNLASSPHLELGDFPPEKPLALLERSHTAGIPGGHLYIYAAAHDLADWDAIGQRVIDRNMCHVMGVTPNHFDLIAPQTAGYSVIFQILPLMMGVLAVFPLFGLAKLTGADPRPVILLFPLVPMVALHSPGWDVVYMALGLTGVCMALRSALWSVGVGSVVLALATVLNPLLLVLAVLVIVYRYKDHVWATLLILVAAVVAVHVAVVQLTGQAVWLHPAGTATWDSWLVVLWTAALFVGLPMATYAALNRRNPAPSANARALRMAMLATGVVLLAANYINDAAAYPLLTFLVPFLLVIAVRREGWRVLMVLQGAFLLAVTVAFTPLPEPSHVRVPPPPLPSRAEVLAQSVEAQYGDMLTLHSWQGAYTDGTATLSMVWSASRVVRTLPRFAVLAVSPEGVATETVTWQMHERTTAMHCWPPHYPVRVDVSIPLPEDATAGGWFFSVSAYASDAEFAAGNRMPVVLPDGAEDTQTGIGPVIIP